jgi:hypothetical protein
MSFNELDSDVERGTDVYIYIYIYIELYRSSLSLIVEIII